MEQWPKTTTDGREEPLPASAAAIPESTETGRWRRLRFELPAIAALLLICTGFFWKLVLSNQYTWLDGPDLANQVLPWMQMQVGELQAGRFPLWDPYMFGGEPLLAQAQPGTAYPLNWLLMVLPTSNGYITQRNMNWYFVLIHFLAASTCYLLCRDLRLSRGASMLGGCVYGLGGYMNQITWPQMLNPAVWTPLVLLFTLRAIAGRRPWGSAAMAGLCLGVSFLCGHHQTPIYTGLMAAGVWLWAVFREARLDRTMAARFALFLAIAGMTGAFQLLPAYEYSKLAYRWVSGPAPVTHNDPVPYTVHEHFGLKSWMLLGLVLPGVQQHSTAYVGITASVLALLGWALAWGRRETRIVAAVAVGGLLYALGAEVFLHGIMYSLLPIVDKARNASMAIVIFHLALAVLAAMAVDALPRDRESPWIWRVKRGALWFALIVWIALAFIRRDHWASDAAFAFTAMAAIMAAALLHGWQRGNLGRTAAVTCLLGVTLLELSQGPSSSFPPTNDSKRTTRLPRIARDDELVKALRALPPGRADLRTENFPHNVGDFHGIEIYNGYLASMLRAFHEMHTHLPRVRELFGVRYWVGPEPSDTWTQMVFASKREDWKIWENPNVFPRVWTVHQAERIRHKEDIPRIFENHDWNLREKTFLYGEIPKMETCEGDEPAWLLRRVSNMVRIWVEMRCRGMVVLSDTYYPGWTATVDGAPAEIHAAYSGVRGVVVDKGPHMIEMRYRPWSVYGGAALTLLGLMGAVAVWRLEGRQKSSADMNASQIPENDRL